MSLYIDVDEITGVLLADGWHVVADKSFALDAYEFHYLDDSIPHDSVNTGARWTDENDNTFWCPLTSVLALRKAKI